MKVTTPVSTPFATGNDTADTALNKAASSLHEAVDKVAEVADDAAREVAPAIDRAAELAHQTVDKVAGVAAPTAAWLNEQSNSLKTTQRTVAADTAQYVAAHPWKSIGFALATGFFIGRFIR
jgi:ElaB/YqjD/DUF883 family membrane-anchored ribosome-binding protein